MKQTFEEACALVQAVMEGRWRAADDEAKAMLLEREKRAIMGYEEEIESYQAAVATVPGWSGLNFFLFSVSLYQNYNGLLILPILAGVSQILTTKLMPQQQQQPQADSQQKGMNGFMKWFFPILSIYFCLSSNAGFAIYWVTSNVVAGVQSVVINKMLEHQDKKKQKTVSGEGSVI